MSKFLLLLFVVAFAGCLHLVSSKQALANGSKVVNYGDPNFGPCSRDRARSLRRPVSNDELYKFVRRVQNLTRAAMWTLNKTLNDTAALNKLQDVNSSHLPMVLSSLDKLMMDLIELGGEAQQMMEEAKILVARTFLVGFQDEGRCPSMPYKRGNSGCSGKIDKRMGVRNEQFIICLFDNVGIMVETVMDIYREVEYHVEMNMPELSCSHMVTELEAVRNGTANVSTIAMVKVLTSFLHKDLGCIGEMIRIFADFVDGASFEKESADDIRKGFVIGLAVFDMIYKEASRTLDPVQDIIIRLRVCPSDVWNAAGECQPMTRRRRTLFDLLELLER